MAGIIIIVIIVLLVYAHCHSKSDACNHVEEWVRSERWKGGLR